MFIFMYDDPFFIIARAIEHGTFIRCGASDFVHLHVYAFMFGSSYKYIYVYGTNESHTFIYEENVCIILYDFIHLHV